MIRNYYNVTNFLSGFEQLLEEKDRFSKQE